jgi:hypothetical protein
MEPKEAQSVEHIGVFLETLFELELIVLLHRKKVIMLLYVYGSKFEIIRRILPMTYTTPVSYIFSY